MYPPVDERVAAHPGRRPTARADRRRRRRRRRLPRRRGARRGGRSRPGATACTPATGSSPRTPRSPQRCAAAGLTFIGPSPDGARPVRRQGRAPARWRSRWASRSSPGSAGAVGVGRGRGAVAADDRLPGDAQGGGRRRRARHARRSTRADEMAEAFDRCRSEAAAAFGDGSLFVERLIARPRHIEVQILADAHGQRRPPLRPRLLGAAPQPEGGRGRAGAGARRRRSASGCSPSAVALGDERRGYVNAGTVEFLVVARDRRVLLHRVQPADPGRAHRHRAGHRHRPRRGAVPHRRRRVARRARARRPGRRRRPAGFAVQARVVATGTGALTAYKEPSGPGVRVDACGYVGYAPPPQFDPLLAKVIGSTSSRVGRRRGRPHPARASTSSTSPGCRRTWPSCSRSSPTPTCAPAMPARRCSPRRPSCSAPPAAARRARAAGAARAARARRGAARPAPATRPTSRARSLVAVAERAGRAQPDGAARWSRSASAEGDVVRRRRRRCWWSAR